MVYADADYYKNVFCGNLIPDEELNKALRQASRHIDTLTYNRIVGRGVTNLTEFQRGILKEVCCEQAEFEYQNKEMLDMTVTEYSINGVSMKFGESWNVHIKNGVAIKRDIYELLNQTGLCCKIAR